MPGPRCWVQERPITTIKSYRFGADTWRQRRHMPSRIDRGSRPVALGVLAAALTLVASAAVAQTAIALPDTSQTTTLTANVTEQAKVTVPAGVTFNVTNAGNSTAASAASVTVQNIVLATSTK